MMHFSMSSPVGELMIRHNAKALCAIEFAGASIDKSKPMDYGISIFEQLQQYFKGETTTFDLTLDIEGTAFQKRVWSALISIPYGTTISYMDLAKKLGDPKCIRAAASANGKNRIPIVIPCHRVIGSNGNLVGYIGGMDIKRKLLSLEGCPIIQPTLF